MLRETPTSLALDAGSGLGQVAGYHAMQRCIDKANEVGLAMVTVRNSNHYGIAGYYAMMALPHDMIGISFTNSQPLVAPTYGRTAILGTNPIAVAAPAGHNRPYVLDMATSIVPIGRVTVYQKADKPIPEGWGIDKDGLITTDPNEVLKGGALLALGGSDIMRGYKGYGLSLLVDIFSGILSGASFGKHVGHPNEGKPADVGHFFAAIRVEAFRDIEDFTRDMDTLLDELKNAPKAAGQERIYIHGEKEFELYERLTPRRRAAHGRSGQRSQRNRREGRRTLRTGTTRRNRIKKFTSKDAHGTPFAWRLCGYIFFNTYSAIWSAPFGPVGFWLRAGEQIGEQIEPGAVEEAFFGQFHRAHGFPGKLRHWRRFAEAFARDVGEGQPGGVCLRQGASSPACR